jgi:hypothetical protein
MIDPCHCGQEGPQCMIHNPPFSFMNKSYPLLEKAPPQDTPEFITYLRENNPVIYDGDCWIVIENCKYHTKEVPWYTAFWKCDRQDDDREGMEWWMDIDILWYNFGDWKWIKKAKEDQTVPGRFHIHITR